MTIESQLEESIDGIIQTMMKKKKYVVTMVRDDPSLDIYMMIQ